MYFLYELLIQLTSKDNFVIKLSKPAHMHSSMHIYSKQYICTHNLSVRQCSHQGQGLTRALGKNANGSDKKISDYFKCKNAFKNLFKGANIAH